MKLLLDQNLSRRIIPQIENAFPDSCHIGSVMGETTSDRDIWFYAQENGFAILTKDDDFEPKEYSAWTSSKGYLDQTG